MDCCGDEAAKSNAQIYPYILLRYCWDKLLFVLLSDSDECPWFADQRNPMARQMNEQQKASVPLWFWGIAVVALLWNIIGCVILLSEVFAQEAMMESMTEAQKAWSRSTPSWIYFVFAISVSAGVAGSICLLMRKRMSIQLFTVSFVAVLTQMVYTMLIAGGLQIMGPSGAVMPAVVVMLSIAWLLLTLYFKGKGWLVPYARASECSKLDSVERNTG